MAKSPQQSQGANNPVRAQGHVTFNKFHSGPLPDPETLHQYGPDFADRIMKMAEKEQDHRHDMNLQQTNALLQTLNKDGKIRMRGQLFALLALIFIGGLSGYGFYCKNPTQAASIAVGVIGAIVIAFLTGGGKKTLSVNQIPQDSDA